MNQLRDESVDYGRKVARQMFERRPGSVERHLDEAKVAALLAIAYDAGMTAMARAIAARPVS